jgi:YggT family protein
MSVTILVQLIGLMANLLTILIFIWVILSWIMPPYNPVREALDRIVEPMLAPIRRVIPIAGMMDFSPMILMILIELVARVLVNVLRSFG